MKKIKMKKIKTFLGDKLVEPISGEEYQIRYHQVKGQDKTPCQCCGKQVSEIGTVQHLGSAKCQKHLMAAVNEVINDMKMEKTPRNIEYIEGVLKNITNYNVKRCVRYMIYKRKMDTIERDTRMKNKLMMKELKIKLEKRKILMDMRIFLEQTKKEIENSKIRKWSEFIKKK